MSPFVASNASETSLNSPAANALDLVFCTANILSLETLDRADAIRAELNEVHDTRSAEVTDAIALLALARGDSGGKPRTRRMRIRGSRLRIPVSGPLALENHIRGEVRKWIPARNHPRKSLNIPRIEPA